MPEEKQDGAYKLNRDSKLGLLVAFVLTGGAQGLIGWITELDFSTLPGWLTGVAAAAAASAVGFLTAYVAKNKKTS